MSYYFNSIKPGLDSEESEDELSDILQHRSNKKNVSESEDDEMSTLTFGSLKKAQDIIMQEEDGNVAAKPKKMHIQAKSKYKAESTLPILKTYREEVQDSSNDSDDLDSSEGNSSDDDIGFFEDEQKSGSGEIRKNKKKNKHAPTETSAKRPVSKVRNIEGLVYAKRENQLHQDIRFDKSMGKSENFVKVRERYKFLDEYREHEIEELKALLADRKFISKISEHEKEEMEGRLRSLKSKLQSVKNRELDQKIVKEYEQKINKENKSKFHLKKSEKRKVIQKWKFEHMKSKQREKVMERKRKKRLGKEFKSFEFHKTK